MLQLLGKVVFLAACSATLCLSQVAYAQSSASSTAIDLLRPEARAGIETQLGVRSLDALPQYQIDQAIDDVSGTFSARLRLRYTNTSNTAMQSLPLLLHPNASEELGLQGLGAGALTITTANTEQGPAVTLVPERPGLVQLRFSRALAAGEQLIVRMEYRGRLRQLPAQSNDAFGQAMSSMASMSGAGIADYGLLAMGDGIITVASAYPMVAPYREGAFDLSRPSRVGDLAYNSVAHFEVRTVVPTGLRVFTNLLDGEPQSVANTREMQVVQSRGAMVRDLVLIAGRDLQRETRMVGNVRVASVFRARDAAGGRRVLASAASALATFERQFGPYPYTELELAESTLVGGAGGVEFCGMALIAGMLYRSPDESTHPVAAMMRMWGRMGGMLNGTTLPQPRNSPASGIAAALEFTVAHEVAHQYFAGIVGNDSHQHPSLDEPLAQYLAAVAYGEQHNASDTQSAIDNNIRLNYALYRTLGGNDRPVLRDTSTFRTGVEYAGLVYGKAPFLYFALERRLGANRLHQAMRAAVQEQRFRVINTDTWLQSLERAAGANSEVRSTARRYLQETYGDQDLGVDASGTFVMRTLFGEETANALQGSTQTLGMPPRELLRMLFGGGIQNEPYTGPGFDPSSALQALPPR